jgi:PAS domain S-box-containing protein
MVTSTSGRGVGFRRCAVCKIDLKGRFVYIDEEIENLLGCTKEELFGKTIIEFLDEPSQEVVNRLISQRNHYESFYDTTGINIVNQDGRQVHANVVASLNFIAGNPVNFQLIIDAKSSATSAGESLVSSSSYDDFFNGLLQIEKFPDLKQFAHLLRGFCGASLVAVYNIGDDELEPRTGATDDSSAEFAFKSIPDPDDLHLEVARTGETYVFTDEKCVRAAVESFGEAPDEYVARLDINGNSGYLVRLVFAEGCDLHAAAASIKKAEMALKLFTRLAQPPPEPQQQDNLSPDVKFTVGFLDSLGIGACLTRDNGDIAGYNPTFVRQVNDEQLNGSYRIIVETLAKCNGPEVLRDLVAYLESPPDEDQPEDFNAPIITPSGEAVCLAVIKFSVDPNDSSGCFVLMPRQAATAEAGPEPAEKLPWAQIIETLHETVLSVTGFSDRLSHKYYNELGQDGNDCLKCLNENSAILSAMLTELNSMLKLAENTDAAEIADLNLLINRAIQEVTSAHPEITLRCRYNKLPKISTVPKVLTAVFANLLSNSIRHAGSSKVVIDCRARVEDNQCVMTFYDKGTELALESIKHLFDFSPRMPLKDSSVIPGQGSSMAATRFLVTCLGGTITVEPKEGQGITVRLTVPVGENEG